MILWKIIASSCAAGELGILRALVGSLRRSRLPCAFLRRWEEGRGVRAPSSAPHWQKACWLFQQADTGQKAVSELLSKLGSKSVNAGSS